jgi:hypothetical protein
MEKKKCSKCGEVKSLNEFTYDNRSKDGRVSRCKECKRNDNKNYHATYGRVLTPEQKKDKGVYDVDYKRTRRKDDPYYRLRDNISRLIRKGINKGYTKNSSTYEILGCTDTYFKHHIESQFQNDMSWNNMGRGKGKWHEDHIIPISSAKNEEEYYLLNHYTNFQPLWEEDNLKKSNKYKEEDKVLYLENLKKDFQPYTQKIKELVKRNHGVIDVH